jgi:acetyltransferase-like isoleucine patch superfamily enzyme
LNGCFLHAQKKIVIGKYCLIAANTCIIDSHGHSTLDTDKLRRHLTKDIPREIIIEDFVWIGLNCIITKGVRIGEGSIIGCGSIVTHDIPAWTLAAGNPAKVIRRIDQESPPLENQDL